ncbi:histamine H2 receptor-like [Diadema antillarum]|uniref:histamine H2 receptor-like n=1 Tax=Diadema antillarum TaxID=105358 RepID=UPI003A863F8F
MANLTEVDLTSSSGASVISMVYASGVVVNILLTFICNVVNLVVLPKLNDISDVEKVLYVTLSITDLLVGITLIPLVPSAVLRKWIFGKIACNVHGLLIITTPICSSCLFLFLNVDRFLAVFKPLKYHHVGYVEIVRVAFRHARKIQHAVLAPKTPDAEHGAAKRPRENIPPIKERMATGTKSIALMIIVTGSFSLCWLPFSIIESYLLIHPDGIPMTLRLFDTWPPQANSWMNAVIFLILKKSYRQKVQRCFSFRKTTGD